MTSFFDSSFLRLRVLLLPMLAVMACLGGTASAAAPRAPANLTLQTSLTGAPNTSGTGRYYLLNWDDRSEDESGFRVEIRLGEVGAFSPIGTVEANTTIVRPAYTFNKDYIIQFRVSAFKFNGTKIESSSSNVVSTVVTVDSSSLNAPTNLALTNLIGGKTYDGRVRLSWNDTSNCEAYYQIFSRKVQTPAVAFTSLGLLNLNAKDVEMQLGGILNTPGFIPGSTYQFAVRATRRSDSSSADQVVNLDSALSNIVNFAVPTLNPPTELSGEPLNQSQVVLRWKDNSTNETSYQIEYKAITTDVENPPAWTVIGSVGPDTTSVTIPTGPGSTLEWRVSAVHEFTGITKIVSAPTNIHTISTIFPSPTGLVAVTSGVSGAIDLTWQDMSEAETNYDIYTRVSGTEDWFYAQSMLANTTRATVTARVEQDPETEDAVSVPLALDTQHDFYVQARYASTQITSQQSNVATAIPRHGFTSRTYQPAKVEVPFTYTLAVSNSGERSSWNVSGLPEGLSFDPDTGIIAGTPTQSGVFACPMTVHYNNYSATQPLTLRILKKDALPVVSQAIPTTTLGTGTQFTIPLADKFADADSEKAVKLRLSGNREIDILLYPSLTPAAVDNFMGYVESGAYDGVIFHRSVPNFIVQGGAYVPVQTPNYFASLLKRPSPLNEPGISNIRGTISAAKVGGNPDSATHDFFFNLEDNSLKENIELDNQNGGFTAFGRVAGNGMTVVDALAALPIGVYKDYNTSGGTSASLDRRVYLDGTDANSKVAFEEVPMDVGGSTAPLTMNVNNTVQILEAVETPVIKYTVNNENPTAVRATVINGSLRLDGLAIGTSTIAVTASDLDGHSIEQSFAVNIVRGYKAPVITRQPISAAVLAGKKATLSVTATGTALTYQWRKKTGETWAEIPGAVAKTLVFAAVQEEDLGTYDVLVSNGTTTLTSTEAKVSLRAAPVITEHPQRMIVEMGDPLILETEVDGAPAPAITWLRNGRTVAGQKQATLNIPATKVTDGGTYTMRAKNIAGTADSDSADVIVVDKTSRLAASLPNRKVILKAQASGPPGMVYQWKKNGTLLFEDTATLKGTQTPTLTISSADFGVTLYRCVVLTDDPEFQSETGDWRVSIVQRPTYDVFTPETAYVGLDYDYTLPGGGPESNNITSFSVSGLPAGLKLEAATGRIRGKPSKSGRYTLKVIAKNPAGSSPFVSVELLVLPMPEPVVGVFVGQIGASTAINGGKGGRVDMTVTETGLITGKLTQGKEVLSFKGVMEQTPGAVRTTGRATIIRRGNTPLELTLTSIGISGQAYSGDVSGVISDGVNATSFSAYRNSYNTTWNPNYTVNTFNIGLNLTDDSVNQEAVPQGLGYFSAIPNSAGVVKVVGRLSDGTSFTSSSYLGGQLQFLIYQSLYKHTGAIVGQAAMSYIETNQEQTANLFRVDGQLLWNKDAQASTKERTYKAGFSSVILDALGTNYIAPSSTDRIVMSLPNAEGNARLIFAAGGLENAIVNPNVPALRINNLNEVSIAAGSVSNPAKASLTINKNTGLFTGRYELNDTTPARVATISGMIIPQIKTIPARTYSDGSTSPEVAGAAAIGAGYFLLPQLPSEEEPVTTIKTSPILSGSAVLHPTPISIQLQPQSLAVDPGQNATFSVVASAPGGALSYQWRRDEVSIPGATSSAYSISSVNESNEGEYDVVITTPYSRVTSQVAVLEINNPVSNIVITRSPLDSPLPVGGSVTFTATAQGSGTLSYRWRFNGSDISGPEAAGATYTINSLTLANSGTYSVRVSNSVTPAGSTSGGLSITVANPITAVVAQRTPSTEFVGIGGNVTFTIASITGSAGPYTYQWRKNGANITNATSASYFINFVNGESAGDYSVLVKNGPTPDGVESAVVPLAVTTAVSNVNATRTPSAEFVPLAASVTFTVSSQGEGPFTYQWKKGGENIVGAESVNYTIASIQEGDVGTYTVLVSNNYNGNPTSSLSNPVPLAIQVPVTSVGMLLNPNTSVIPAGDTITMTASPNASGPYSYRWYKNESQLTEYDDEPSITLNGVGEADAGDYRVEVQNDATPSPVSSPTINLEVITDP